MLVLCVEVVAVRLNAWAESHDACMYVRMYYAECFSQFSTMLPLQVLEFRIEKTNKLRTYLRAQSREHAQNMHFPQFQASHANHQAPPVELGCEPSASATAQLATVLFPKAASLFINTAGSFIR